MKKIDILKFVILKGLPVQAYGECVSICEKLKPHFLRRYFNQMYVHRLEPTTFEDSFYISMFIDVIDETQLDIEALEGVIGLAIEELAPSYIFNIAADSVVLPHVYEK